MVVLLMFCCFSPKELAGLNNRIRRLALFALLLIGAYHPAVRHLFMEEGNVCQK